ncbi:Uncharacterised protein [Mycobacteroides abscessus subsp. abscessus]|nr:Uncharacterised protein [Mycobacteroides abscessus subsp. abscessus]
MTPADTSTNANNVPTLTISSSPSIGVREAATATRKPTISVIRIGVPCEPVRASSRGSSPSRHIAKITRICPSISTMTTVVSPANAPTAITLAAQSTPLRWNAVDRFGWESATRRSLYLTMPESTTVTATYRTVTMTNEAMMPRGTSFCGFRVSSAVVATTSKPMNAKKTIDAPASTPNQPY